MSFSSIGYDNDVIAQKQTDNDKLFDFRMNTPRLRQCYSNQPGYLPEASGVQNTALESQMKGLTRKLSRQMQENEWNADETSQWPQKLSNCEYTFDDVKDRSNFSENNLVSDIILRRFEHVPFDYKRLAEIRRPSIGMDTRQYTKEKWRKDQNNTKNKKNVNEVTSWF
jgi:hypothetical protein